ncbi:MAG: glycosyltransferase family 1 protein, partial [Lachnospiraceae bacterium]|nr:glycosyltransferase family 1 protein [Lachnospiraceae bacterium]
MKRMLHIVGSMAPGGIENFLMHLYRNIDRELLQFDFIVNMKKENGYDEEIQGMGGKMYYATRKSVNPLKNFLEVRRIIKGGGYDTVCRHSDNAFTVVDLLAAKLAGAKRIIMHSHSTDTAHKKIHGFFRLWMPWVTTHRFACSGKAGRWMYGKADFQVIPNAIDTRLFSYSGEERERLRRQWKVEDKHVYGHVGSFVYAKNHALLLDIFANICKQDEKAVLICVGDGPLRPEIEAKTEELKLTQRVILTGKRGDVPAFLQMFDLLLFPSRYEGLPVSVVEAQATGLRCLISDTITKEVLLTAQAEAMEPRASAEQWALRAADMLTEESVKVRRSYEEEIKAAGYDIASLA